MKLARPVGGESSRQSWRVILGIVPNSVRTRTSFGNNKFGKISSLIRVIVFAFAAALSLAQPASRPVSLRRSLTVEVYLTRALLTLRVAVGDGKKMIRMLPDTRDTAIPQAQSLALRLPVPKMPKAG